MVVELRDVLEAVTVLEPAVHEEFLLRDRVRRQDVVLYVRGEDGLGQRYLSCQGVTVVGVAGRKIDVGSELVYELVGRDVTHVSVPGNEALEIISELVFRVEIQTAHVTEGHGWEGEFRVDDLNVDLGWVGEVALADLVRVEDAHDPGCGEDGPPDQTLGKGLGQDRPRGSVHRRTSGKLFQFCPDRHDDGEFCWKTKTFSTK